MSYFNLPRPMSSPIGRGRFIFTSVTVREKVRIAGLRSRP